MNRKRSWVLVAVLAFGGTAAAAPAVAGQRPVTQVAWGECPEDVTAAQLQCATVKVPMNYADPGGPQLDLMISRLPSPNPAKRRGVLMLNPGGPSGSGLALSALLVTKGLPADVLDSYDLIGMDTRGIGHSSPVSCGFTLDGPYYANIPPYAPDDAAVVRQAEVAKGVAEQCARNDRDGRMRHLTTANTARDLDRIRAALGEEKTSFLGYSYGTALGAAYASMFPERSDRMVLDSNIGDTALDRDGLRRYALGTEQSFPDFAAWAAARHDSYGLGRTPEEVRETYLGLAAQLDGKPVQGIDGSLLRLLTFGRLFNEVQYGEMAQTLQSLLGSGEATGQAQGSGLSPADNGLSVFLSVTCNDVEWPEDVDTYRRGVAEDRERFPLYGAAAANILPCAFWPHEPAEPRVAINDDGPENVLLVQNRRDPATPHRGGELLREQFADRSRLVSVDAGGHGAYVLGGNACALNTTTRYLVDGELPDHDVQCGAGPVA